MASHDSGYKQIFSHQEMVRDLLQGFVKEEWVEQLDFSTLEKVSGSYVTDDLRDRQDDIIWKVCWGQDWIFIYIILEFQSTVDPFMSVRMSAYVMLLYQDLIKSGQVKAGKTLPPVLPVVLFNGKPEWTAALDIGDLITPIPGGLDRYRPHMKYLLIDEVRYEDAELAAQRNLAAALFRFEKSRNPEDIRSVLKELADWLKAPEQTSLRRAFTIWLGRVLLPKRVPGQIVPEMSELTEVDAMLAETVQEWTKQWKNEGRQEGEAAMLLRQLKRRFGFLPEWVSERVRSSDQNTLETWGDRVLDAKTLDDIFV